jgi:hypothetical protein
MFTLNFQKCSFKTEKQIKEEKFLDQNNSLIWLLFVLLFIIYLLNNINNKNI